MPPPLITHLYTADPSAHVFEGRLYIYPSHDRDTGIPSNDSGDQYDMADYHVFSLPSLSSYHPSPPSEPPSITDHGPVLALSAVPWASRQLWAPDAAQHPGTGAYHLYFPARDGAGVFRIGVAVGPGPAGPFVADPEPIAGSFSIDPASFVDPDDTGAAYLYFGGLWGGQLQCWQGQGRGRGGGDGDGGPPEFDESQVGPHEPSGPGVPALCPKVAVFDASMRRFAAPPADLVILAPETGEPILADDHERRFFEAAWMHKRGDTYYFSYSTGDTHYLVYATSKSPLGPFTYAGRLLEPVLGWTTHHSIVEFEGRWWLFYHDCELSGGVSHLRCVKVAEIFYDDEGHILPVKTA
ncbi:glycoside hydrolase family 43 protein [Biscogniauxia sp. FL1348]|nr:glycoside hydrolase family 43 protein [Biscogniauxia sp. FL1348]